MTAALAPSTSRVARFARALAAVPVLFSLAYVTCGHGTGFSLAVEIGGLHLAASTCR